MLFEDNIKILAINSLLFKRQIIYTLFNPLSIMLFICVFSFFLYRNIKNKRIDHRSILMSAVKSVIICILYWQIKKMPYRLYDLLIKCFDIYEGLEMVAFNILIVLELLSLLIGITMLYERKWGKRLNNKLKVGFSNRIYLGHVLFFLIAFGVMFFSFALLDSINNLDDEFNLVSSFSMINNGLLSSIIILISGSLTKKIYNIFYNLMIKKYPIRILGYNARMWAFIIVCIIYSIITSNEKLGKISYIASGIIWGKLFWIDEKKESIKKIIGSFWDLPFLVILLYCMFINFSVIYRILQNIDSFGFFNNPSIAYGNVVAILIYIIFLLVRYSNLIKEWIIKEMSKISDSE